MARALRILYAAGPGDVIGTYRHWKEGRDDPSQVAITYSGQFYDLCRQIGADGYVISSNRKKGRIIEGNLRIEHRPLRFARGPAALFHLGRIWYGVRLWLSALRFKADVAVVADGTHWFVLGLMRLGNVRVVPSLHNMLWRKNRHVSGKVNRIIQRLNAGFFQNGAMAVLCVSKDVSEQVRVLLNGKPTPIEEFVPNYRSDAFGDGLGDPPARPPFRVFFAGRIERNKGVFELLELAKRFAAEGKTEIEFDLAGDGSELENLRTSVEAAGMSQRFRCHGHVEKMAMREMYQRCHVVIVPTTSEFTEGFNKVVAEGVLAGRPVITSSVCPALEYVKEAVLAVPPDDTKAYGNAIVQLETESQLYDSKRTGCENARALFCDAKKGWGAALKRSLDREFAGG